jgi:hypothetical protein
MQETVPGFLSALRPRCTPFIAAKNFRNPDVMHINKRKKRIQA